MLIGVVRGISDILEQPTKRRKSKEDDRRPENAKKIASDTAAAFAFWPIFKAYESTLVNYTELLKSLCKGLFSIIFDDNFSNTSK